MLDLPRENELIPIVRGIEVIMEYSLFVPPAQLASRTPREWTGKEANQYAKWFFAEMPSRVDRLLEFLNLDAAQRPEVLLELAGERTAEHLRLPLFSSSAQGRVELTDLGYALAADMGMLVAQLIVEEIGADASWATLKKPRSAAAFHLPVLFTRSATFLEPLGASIGQAHGVLRGDRTPSIWREMYEHCVHGSD